MENKNIMDYETVELDDQENALVIIDQTTLPGKTEIIRLKTAQEMWDAIYLLQVRGAPAIGVAAAFGIYLLAKQIQAADYEAFYSEFKKQKEYLDSSRPTAVNLSWALNRMEKKVTDSKDKPVEEIKALLGEEAIAIKEEDIRVCRTIGEYGSAVKPGTESSPLQCGTAGYQQIWNATATIYLGEERGYHFHVFADETRPLLQSKGLPYGCFPRRGRHLICDNMAATVMKNGWVNAVFVGCDRVAQTGIPQKSVPQCVFG
ncbi:MAG: hypothetical protein ACLUOI_03850 [Eisenbergiella sp.]